MSDPSKINDETYKKMSQLAYKDRTTEDELGNLPGWKVLEDTISNNISGFNAVTFYNPETKQAVIAYRGTEGSAPISTSLPDFIMDGRIGIPEIGRKIDQSLDTTPEWLDKSTQKVRDVTGATHVENWLGELDKKLDKTSIAGKNNQMYEAENYAKEMQSKYKDYKFSLTGHSLGGGNAQYAAAYTGMTAVTFSAPSVISSLTPEVQRKAEEGEFDNQITNFAHPGDFVASGLFGGYDRHVGATYYIDSNYENANKDIGIVEKISNSFGGPNYHSLNQYEFKNGLHGGSIYGRKAAG
ncbi:lipase family protein [Paenibacillus sp. P96]|uniref:Lipase family protein n=1 Tax=Paenibacillus zeirhizosphaerae TaxID=2987519 RepID=A0ABT9FMB4_9BACL|nr:lipase family protein [Paenibacillus sp. P96]MDP4095735.1 lipase family protein [Paenibacillus sp. P96]